MIMPVNDLKLGVSLVVCVKQNADYQECAGHA
jgi:hypothetical protein